LQNTTEKSPTLKIDPNKTNSTSNYVNAFVEKALSRAGTKYVFGQGRTTDPEEDEFDCSGLVWWAATQTGYKYEGASNNTEGIFDFCSKKNTLISIDQAIKTRGALLIRINYPNKINHVAISLGDGRTMEAQGTEYGVKVSNAAGRTWTHAAILPGMNFNLPTENSSYLQNWLNGTYYDHS
jgi:cell wall-associated NlpC family hydrolase